MDSPGEHVGVRSLDSTLSWSSEVRKSVGITLGEGGYHRCFSGLTGHDTGELELRKNRER